MQRDDTVIKPRDIYLNKLIAFQDTEPIKVISGIRRCGKSSLLKLMINHLLSTGISEQQIVEMNFESMKFGGMTHKQFYDHVVERVLPDKKMYLFFDEVQQVKSWQTSVDSFRVDFACDIYISGSNATLLSSEFATYLSGRYVEIQMYPLSFKEFLDFHGYTISEYASPAGGKRKRVLDTRGEYYDVSELFEAFARYGGMPGLADIGLQQDKVPVLLDGIFNTVFVKDILARDKAGDEPQITNPELLRKIILFLADNIGNSTSLSNIANVLEHEGQKQRNGKRTSPGVHTVQNYVNALLSAFLFYDAKRFDIKGKEYLRSNEKYFIVDLGFRNYLLGFRDMDRGHALENIVFFELLRRGFDVSVGKIENNEIDFIATNTDRTMYIQVTETMVGEDVRDRELSPLKRIRDNHEKMVLSLDRDMAATYEGIKSICLLDWLLG